MGNIFSVIIVTISDPASWGVRPGMGGTFGWGAQCPWCSCIAERVPQRHAWPTANKRTLHSLHQHNVWGARTHTHKPKITTRRALVKISVVWCWLFCNWCQCGGLFFPQCWIIQTKRAPSSSWYFCFLPVTATRCSASSACCPQWLHMLKTA